MILNINCSSFPRIIPRSRHEIQLLILRLVEFLDVYSKSDMEDYLLVSIKMFRILRSSWRNFLKIPFWNTAKKSETNFWKIHWRIFGRVVLHPFLTQQLHTVRNLECLRISCGAMRIALKRVDGCSYLLWNDKCFRSLVSFAILKFCNVW